MKKFALIAFLAMLAISMPLSQARPMVQMSNIDPITEEPLFSDYGTVYWFGSTVYAKFASLPTKEKHWISLAGPRYSLITYALINVHEDNSFECIATAKVKRTGRLTMMGSLPFYQKDELQLVSLRDIDCYAGEFTNPDAKIYLYEV